MRAAIFATVVMCCVFSSAAAQQPYGSPPDSEVGAAAAILQVQEALIWTNNYAGPLDGSIGPSTVTAIKNYQLSKGHHPTGRLDLTEQNGLLATANEIRATSGFRRLIDRQTGIAIGLPLAWLTKRESRPFGTNFISADGSVVMGLRFYRSNVEFAQLYNAMQQSLGPAVRYSVFREAWFVLSGEQSDRKFYFRYHYQQGLVAGFFASFPTSMFSQFAGSLSMSSFSLQPFALQASDQLLSAPPIVSLPLENVGASAANTSGIPSVAQPNETSSSADVETLFLQNVRDFVMSSGATNAKFYMYKVDKGKLSGFSKDMPLLRVVFEERVFFDTAEWAIRPEANSALELISNSLKQQTINSAIFVAGHSDSRGNDKYNLELSVKRAGSVAEELLHKGIGSATVWKIGFGKAVPLRPNDTETNMALNRRVEFLLATQPSIIATWIATQSTSLCEANDGTTTCDAQSGFAKFTAQPVLAQASANIKPPNVSQIVPKPVVPIVIDLTTKTIAVDRPTR